MKDMSFLEKLKVLVDVSSSSGLCVATIFILIFLAVFMLTTNKKNGKSTKIFFSLIYLALVVVMLIQYWTSLASMFDYMMNNFFIVVYFPNLAIYLAAIIATNIILWKTIFNYRGDKLLKIVNTIIYAIMHYLLVLILNIVSTNKLDVFDKSSVYGNQDALALISLSSTVFIVWIIFMIIYKVIRSRQCVQKEMNVYSKHRIPSNILEVAVPRTVKDIPRKTISDNVIRIPVPKIVKGLPVKRKEPVIIQQTSLTDFYKEDSLLKKYDNMLTLEDYKIVLDLLKNNKTTNIKIDSNDMNDLFNEENEEVQEKVQDKTNIYSSYRLEEVQEDYVQPCLDELLNLSKSV